jgi:hypothetical protein
MSKRLRRNLEGLRFAALAAFAVYLIAGIIVWVTK